MATLHFEWKALLILAGCAAVSACHQPVRPPQTEMFVLDGPSPEVVGQVVNGTAADLRLKLSEKTFHTPAGELRDYEAYGGGLSLFVLQRMRDFCPDALGNFPPAQVDPERYDVLVGKTGLWASRRPEEILAALSWRARKAGMGWSSRATVDAAKNSRCQGKAGWYAGTVIAHDSAPVR